MQTGTGLDRLVTGLDSRVIHLLSVCERLVGVRELVAQRVVSARVCFIWGSIIMSVRLYTCDYTKAVLSHFYFTSRQPKTKKQNLCNTKIGREISHSDVTLGLVRFQTTPELFKFKSRPRPTFNVLIKRARTFKQPWPYAPVAVRCSREEES